MPDTIRIKSALLKLLQKATQQSVDNLSPSDAPKDIDIDQTALAAILVLLRYHPQKEFGKYYIDKVNRIMRWQEEDASGYRLKRQRKVGPDPSETIIKRNPDPNSARLDEVMDAIMEYGKFCIEWEEKHKKDSA